MSSLGADTPRGPDHRQFVGLDLFFAHQFLVCALQ